MTTDAYHQLEARTQALPSDAIAPVLPFAPTHELPPLDDALVPRLTAFERRAQPSTPRRAAGARVIVQRALLVFATSVLAFFVFLFFFSGLQHGRSQTGLERRFQSDLANAQAPIGGDIAKGTPVALLQIKHLGLREVVVAGTDSGTLRSGPGLVTAFSMPGQAGNSVIVGRRATYGGPFRHLGALHPGNVIDVTTGQGRAHYVVETVRRFGSSNGDFLNQQAVPTLTLVTSDPVLFPTRRLVVTAKLTTTPFPATDHPKKFGANDLGLDGDAHGAVNLALWLEAMLVCSLAGVWMLRRWSLAAAYPIVVAVLLAVSWCVFDSAAVLFPASL
jgi:sortase A